MTEGIGSKHVIFCDNCGGVFRSEKAFEEHKPCKTLLQRQGQHRQ